MCLIRERQRCVVQKHDARVVRKHDARIVRKHTHDRSGPDGLCAARFARY